MKKNKIVLGVPGPTCPQGGGGGWKKLKLKKIHRNMFFICPLGGMVLFCSQNSDFFFFFFFFPRDTAIHDTGFSTTFRDFGPKSGTGVRTLKRKFFMKEFLTKESKNTPEKRRMRSLDSCYFRHFFRFLNNFFFFFENKVFFFILTKLWTPPKKIKTQ